MLLFAAVIAAGFVIGLVSGGRLSGFEHIRVAWWGLALAGLAVQFVPLPEGAGGTDLAVRTAVLAVSYAMLLVFAVRNVRFPGVALLLVGLALNAAVVVANGGMPVSPQALRASGQEDVLEQLRAGGADKHHLETPGDVLRPLGDVIAIPPPVAQAVSVGDLVMYAGLVWSIVTAMREPTRPARCPGSGYRGRHRPDRVRRAPSAAPSIPTPPLPAATTSGTER